MVARLDSFGAQWLLEATLEKPVWLVEGLLPTSSTAILASPPKFGKSWLCLQLGQAVATGTAFLNRATTQAGVLYLCLEDQKHRLQNRLWAIADESTDDFRLVESASTLGGELIAQLEEEIRLYPSIKLVIVDTLQITRDANADYSYAADYADLRKFKEFADKHKLACVVVHHLRKARCQGDKFADISGTTAISGACDGMLVLKKENRGSANSTLSITGRDVEYTEMILRRENSLWCYVETVSSEEVAEQPVPDCIIATARFMAGRGRSWQGRASDLLAAIGEPDMNPGVFGKKLAQFSGYLSDHGILYACLPRTGSTRQMSLEIIQPDDSMTADDSPLPL